MTDLQNDLQPNSNPHFDNFTSLTAFLTPLPQADSAIKQQAVLHNQNLTKPPRALGRLEDIAIWYASWRGQIAPLMKNPQVLVFAGNHGVASLGVSAFPPEVTEQMVANFHNGGAAINQLCKCYGARLDVLALDLNRPTADFTQTPAMTQTDCLSALQTGWQNVDETADMLIAGEMGIGNTTAAAAICCALYDGAGADWAGRGTGVDQAGLARKTAIIDKGLARYHAAGGLSTDGLNILANFGGREMAAMVGAIARARALSIPVLLDGFICTAAAAILTRLDAGFLDHCLAAHQSDETAHKALLAKLGKAPILSLDMRLGEASGAALALGIVQGALACHANMASFESAGVSQS